jgi:hypothetical protein
MTRSQSQFFSHRKVTSNILHALEIRRRNRVVKTLPKMRPSNVTPFVLEGRWALAPEEADQATKKVKTVKYRPPKK